MSVTFEEDYTPQQHYQVSSSPEGIAGFLIQKGIVQTEAAAQKLLFGVLIICILIIGYFMFFTEGPTEPTSGSVPSDQFIAR